MSDKTVAIVTGTVDDLYRSNNEKDYCIHYLKESKLFDSIIIATPDTKESYKIKQLSSKWGGRVF